MKSISDFHPFIQTSIFFYSSQQSLGTLAKKLDLSKEAVRKRVQKATEHLNGYGQKSTDSVEVELLKVEIQKLKGILSGLRKEMLLKSTIIYLLEAALERVRRFCPRFKLTRLEVYEKKYLLEMLQKFRRHGGTLKEFCKAIAKSPETLLNWEKAYQKYGLNGLVDKRTRPKNFGNKIPSWVKQQLLRLFFLYPKWSEYQIHMYVKHDPSTRYYVSVPTIKKLKSVHQIISQQEKNRILKRWAFEKNHSVWIVDFTVLYKTDNYKLQLLTVSDARSRYAFDTALFLSTSTDFVIDHLKGLFLKFGKPNIIKADNGPEFRVQCQNDLNQLSVYLFNNPKYYGQFNGSHERIHRSLKRYIDKFSEHQNLIKLVDEIKYFLDQYNHDIPLDYLEGKTPAEVFYSGENFVPKNTEIVVPYIEDDELRMKFTNRNGKPARISLAKI